jgi:hypothetical protein
VKAGVPTGQILGDAAELCLIGFCGGEIQATRGHMVYWKIFWTLREALDVTVVYFMVYES